MHICLLLCEPEFSTVVALNGSCILYLHDLVNLTLSMFCKAFLKLRKIWQPTATSSKKNNFVWLIRRLFVERLAALDNITVKPALLHCHYTWLHLHTQKKIPLILRKYQSFIYSPTDALVSCLKKPTLKFILKFTLKFILKRLVHVSVLQLHHHHVAAVLI